MKKRLLVFLLVLCTAVIFPLTLYASPGSSFLVVPAISDTQGGTVDGIGVYSFGDTCTLTVVTRPDYQFVCWSEDGITVSLDPVYTFTVTDSRIVTAQLIYLPDYAQIHVSYDSDRGTVTGQETFLKGETCTLTATAKPGNRFDGWFEGETLISAQEVYAFSVQADRNLEARFSEVCHIGITVNGPGTVSGGGVYVKGETCTLTAQFTGTYGSFGGWKEDGVVVSENPVYTFTATQDRTLEAVFLEYVDCEIKTGIHFFKAGGAIYGAGTYRAGTTCTLKARPYNNFSFDGWVDENGHIVSRERDFTFTVTRDATYTVLFTYHPKKICPIAASPSVGNSYTAIGGTVSGAGLHDAGTECTLVAQPKTGYRFDGWLEDGKVVSTDLVYTFTVTEARTLKAKFTAIYTITVLSNNEAYGGVTGGGIYGRGEAIELTAIPYGIYKFSYWESNGTILSRSPTYRYNAGSSRTVTAVFTQALDVGSTFVQNGITWELLSLEPLTVRAIRISAEAMDQEGRLTLSPTVTYQDRTFAVEEIGERAGENLTSLRHLTLEDGVNLGEEAFYGCTALQEVWLMGEEVSLGWKVFAGREQPIMVFYPDDGEFYQDQMAGWLYGKDRFLNRDTLEPEEVIGAFTASSRGELTLPKTDVLAVLSLRLRWQSTGQDPLVAVGVLSAVEGEESREALTLTVDAYHYNLEKAHVYLFQGEDALVPTALAFEANRETGTLTIPSAPAEGVILVTAPYEEPPLYRTLYRIFSMLHALRRIEIR